MYEKNTYVMNVALVLGKLRKSTHNLTAMIKLSRGKVRNIRRWLKRWLAEKL